MRVPGAAVIAAEARAHAGRPLSLRSSLLVPCGLGLALLVVWPRATIAAVMRIGPSPNPFDVVAVCLVLLAVYLGARHGSEDYDPGSAVRLRDLVRFTPVSLAEIVLGKAAFGVVHTAFLLLLGAPFVVASLAVGGAGGAEAVRVLAVTGAACLCARMLGLLVLVVVRGRALVRDVVLFTILALAIVLALLFLPMASPIDAVVARTPRQTGISAGISLTVALALAVTAAFAMRILRRPDA
ncbi:MAG TPA: hypothetical protein VHE79_11260 [Spirochaetia bacterium]